MRHPFQNGFSTRAVVSIVAVTYALASLFNLPEFFFFRYLPKKGELTHPICYFGASSMFFVATIKNSLFVSFVPLPIILILQMLSYNAITRSARQFQWNSHRVRTIKSVRQTFSAVVAIFFFLTAPTEIFGVTIVCIWKFAPSMMPPMRTYDTLARLFNLLLSCNSCANPFIYAKIHRKFTRCLQWICQPIVQRYRRSKIRKKSETYVIQVRQKSTSGQISSV